MRNFLVVAAALVAGGGEQAPESKTDVEKASVISGSVIMPYYPVAMSVTNNSARERVCSFSYSFRDWDGSVVNGPQTPPQLVSAGQSISATTSVPLNQIVAFSAGCQHPEYPCLPGYTCADDYAANSSRTEPVRDRMTCRANYYEESDWRAMNIACH